MAIYDIFNAEKNIIQEEEKILIEKQPVSVEESGNRFFSSLAARVFFFLLLIADILWAGYSLLLFFIGMTGQILSFGKNRYFRKVKDKSWISLRRSLVCGLALFIALFSPAFGIMVACTYFLMYDKSGIEEVVPSSLQAQFKEFFPKE